MKIIITKENGKIQASLDGETGDDVSREISLFPGQNARVRVTVSRLMLNPEVRIILWAARNGQVSSREEIVRLQTNEPLGGFEGVQIPRWIHELTEWAKKIPLKEEIEIEF